MKFAKPVIQWPIFVTLIVLHNEVRAENFKPCGGKSGIRLATQGAAAGAKMLSSCGFDFLLGIGMPAQLLWDVFPTVCMGIRLCYARHEEKNADLGSFRKGVAECIGRGLSFAKGIRPDLFSHVTSELIPHAQECMRTTLPSDVRVALAMMRYARNIMLRGRTG